MMKQIPQHTIDFIDSWLTLNMKWERAPWVAVAISHKGKTLLDSSYTSPDYADMTVPSVKQYRFASHTKMVTAVALMQLQARGALYLDDPVVTFLPWLRDHDDARWKDVTIRQLMSHSAGVVRDGSKDDFWALRSDFPDEGALREIVLAAKLVYDPNTIAKYSNIGFAMLGLVIAQVTGQSYAEYVTRAIFGPLRLQHTSIEGSTSSSMVCGYSRRKLDGSRVEMPYVETKALDAAAGICSTPQDMTRFLLAVARADDKLGILASVSRELRHPVWKMDDTTSYGLGFVTKEIYGHTLFGHSGGFPGYMSMSLCDAESEFAISVVTTGLEVRPGVIAHSLAEMIYEFGDESPTDEHKKFEVRLTGQYGASEVIAHAQGLRYIYPKTWWPMNDITKLEVIDETTLHIVKTGSYDNPGEDVRYEFADDGSINCVHYSNEILMPSEDDELIPWW